MKHIAILAGGLSSEREVSLSSGNDIQKALDKLGYKTTIIDINRDIVQQIKSINPDIIFNALHGTYGEDGAVQGVLEILNIPYTHSGILASALAMNKIQAKRIFEMEGIRCAKSIVASSLNEINMPYPFVIKPINEGSSIGVIIVKSAKNIPKKLPKNEFMVEEYIKGREVSVAILNGKALGVVEILPPKDGFYDYSAKYQTGKARHIMPAPLDKEDEIKVMHLAEKAHKSLGCTGLTRADFRFDDSSLGASLFYLLEINTQPGMTPLSLAPEIAAHAGINYNELVEELVKSATIHIK